MDRQCKKLHWSIYSAPDSAKKQQQQFTYGQTVQKKTTTAIYIWTDSAKEKQKKNSNLHMDRQCKKKTTTAIYIWTDSAKKQQQQFTYGQTVQKKNNNSNLHMDRQCKKNNNSNLHMDRQCKKTTTAIYIWTDSAKKQQQQFTYGQYIFTDCTEDNVQNTHTCTQYA